jgi:hypothetical protein
MDLDVPEKEGVISEKGVEEHKDGAKEVEKSPCFRRKQTSLKVT